MQAKIENGKLIITIELQPAAPSKSGKTMLIATSGGNKATTAVIDGKPVIIGFNAYIQR